MFKRRKQKKIGPGIVYFKQNWKYTTATYFKKMSQPRPLFVYFCSFQKQILQKNCICQLDSNTERQSRRKAYWPLDHHHGPNKTATLHVRNFQPRSTSRHVNRCRRRDACTPDALALASTAVGLFLECVIETVACTAKCKRLYAVVYF